MERPFVSIHDFNMFIKIWREFDEATKFEDMALRSSAKSLTITLEVLQNSGRSLM